MKLRSIVLVIVYFLIVPSKCVPAAASEIGATLATCSVPIQITAVQRMMQSACDDAPDPKTQMAWATTALRAGTNDAAVGAATVGCEAVPSTATASKASRPADAAPIRYPGNDASDVATFIAPEAIFAKLGVSRSTAPLRLKSCKLERWFQTAAAQSGTMYVVDPKRMVYEVVTSFDHYEGRGGEWNWGRRIFVVDAVSGDAITTLTTGRLVRTSINRQMREKE